MPVNGVRVLPDIPKNMPNIEILIREFEMNFRSPSASRNITSKSSTLSDSNFVKKIVEAYESSVRASTENCQRERAKRKSDLNNFDVTQNHKNIEKNSNLGIYDASRLHCRNNFDKKSKVFLTPFETREIEDDFIILNRYHSKSDEKTVSKVWSEAFPKINMYGSMDEPLVNVQSSPLKSNEWNMKRRDQKSENKTNKTKLMICSICPLGDVEDKDLDCNDFLDDILTSSCDSSSNNSYRNLQADLYNFKDEQLELSSTSLSSLKSSESSHNNMLSINSDDGSLFMDLSFQDITITSSKDIPKSEENLQENLQNSESVPNPSFNFDQKSSRVIDASLNDNRSIKIDNDACVTWTSALGEKLSGKKSLKKLLKSAFNTKLLNYKKFWKKSAEKQSHEHTFDSGFIEWFLCSSSSSSQESWRSDPNHDEKPSIPTFSTFGRAKNACVSDKTSLKSSRMVLTEMPCEKFTNDSEPFDLTALQHTTTSCKENYRNVESSSKSPILASSSKLKASCGYPPLPKHPYLTRNGIPKHPFVAKTNLDQTVEKESMEEEEEEKEVRCDAKEHESDARELEPSDTSSVCQTELNISFSRMSEWLTSSPNSNLLR